MVSVNIITNMDTETETAHANHLRSSNIPRILKEYATVTPISAENRCPKNTFFGWENFAFGAPNTNTAVAPKDAMRYGLSDTWSNPARTAMARKENATVNNSVGMEYFSVGPKCNEYTIL